jgi:signal transduction histidine kinase
VRLSVPDDRLLRVVSLAADSRGTLWLTDRERGVLLLKNGELVNVPAPPGVADVEPNFVHVDRHDRLWLGFSGATVAVIGPSGTSRLHRLQGAIGTVLSAVYEDQEGAIWIGGMRGLSRISGDTVDVVSQPDNLPGYGVFGITEDREGFLWLGVGSGIVRLSVNDFERAARQDDYPLAYRFYDASDGLTGVPARLGFPGATRRGDGTLWFITSRGTSVVRPDDLNSDVTPPAVRIESVRADDRLVRPEAGAAFPPGTSRLLFEYTTMNLTSPLKDRFQYRLEGVDTDWVVAGSRREAFYPNLRSGSYRFQVARLTSDQPPEESAATWEFSIRPMYYETWWFLWGCVALAGLMAWTAWQMRLRQLRRQFALVFAERARMSRELHDTLLQDLVGVTLHFDELAANLGPSSGPATGQVVRLRRYLERAIGEARQAVWDLRSEHPEEEDLPRVLRESGERAFAGKHTRFETTVVGTPRRCAPSVEQHLLRIAREALCNAARHADASSVNLTLDYRTDAIVLRVTDDGRGCPTAEVAGEAPGHYGFVIMRERTEQAGGQFRVETSPGQGTQVEVTIPAHPVS